MPPPNNHKRKRDGVDSSRPSPHKPNDQHNFSRDNRHRKSRPDRRESNSRGNPSNSFHNSQNSDAQSGPSPAPSTTVSSRPASASSQLTPQSATGPGLNFGGNNPAVSNASFTMTAPTSPAVVPKPEPVPFVQPDSSIVYTYTHLTDAVLRRWSVSGHDAIVGPIAESVRAGDYHQLTFWTKDIVYSVLSGRLQPVDAGQAVKKIIGPAPTTDPENRFGFEPHTHFADSLTLMFEYNMDHFRPQLLHFLKATGVRPQLLREVCDTALLIKLGLIRETFPKLNIRHATNQLYRQTNYNLLREESEGYSKLMTELFATGNIGQPTSTLVNDTFERIKALIGTFDLDVGRVLDIIIDTFASVLIKHHEFYVKLLRVSSWWPRLEPSDGTFRGGLPEWALPGCDHWSTSDLNDPTLEERKRERDVKFWERAREISTRAYFELGNRQVVDADVQGAIFSDVDTAVNVAARQEWINITKTLPATGNRTAAQLLGFKLRFYTGEAQSEEDVFPANLLYLTALLIKVGFISLTDLMAHLWPDEAGMEELRTEKIKEMRDKEEASRGGGLNALAMAGVLPDDGPPAVSSNRLRDSQKASEEPKLAEEKPKSSAPFEQKIGLLTSLLTVGAIPEALFMIGRYPWILEVEPDVIHRIHRILDHSINEIYESSKPISLHDDTECPARDVIPDDQIGAPRGLIRMEKYIPRRPLRWPFPDTCDTKDNSQYKFYWSDWADNVPVCRSVDDIFTLCETLLNLSGVNIGKDGVLMTKLTRIGIWSLRTDKSKANYDRWLDLLTRLLVPALSMTAANPSVTNLVWDMLKLYPIQTRYRVYANWYEGPSSRLPAIRKAFAQTRLDTLRTMKRLSLDNLNQMAKTLAKASYSSPGIVFKVALDQIEAYANLIEAFVECAKYFTDLAYDVLVWSLLSSLGGGSRSRHQESSVLLTSKWLQALSRFSGKVFRRCTNMSPMPVLRYVNHQLAKGNSTDLIILKELITTMGGIVPTLDFTDDQIMGMTGYSTLRRQTLLNVLDKRYDSVRSSERLVQSLLESKLVDKLLVGIVRYRQNAIFQLQDDELHVKFLSSMVDDSHQILIQYLDFLTHNLTHEQYTSMLPGVKTLMGDLNLDAGLVFMLTRPSISFDLCSSEPPVQADGDVEMTDVPKESQQVNVVYETLKPLIDDIATTQSIEFWEKVSAEFFTTFWALQLGDISVPDARYEKEYMRTKSALNEVHRDRSDPTHSGLVRRTEKMKALTELAEKLSQEKKQHRSAFAKMKNFLGERTPHWFLDGGVSANGIADSLIQNCFLPRAILSPSDAEFTYAMIRYLHDNNVSGFRLQALYDRLFNANRLRSMFFICTVREAENLGRFLKLILADLSKWHRSKDLFETEALGLAKGTSENTRSGFATTFDENGKATAWPEHVAFKETLWGWHKSINTALRAAMSGMEWLHIRNAITVLKCVLDYFPTVDFMGRQFGILLKSIAERESTTGSGQRVDLSVAAQTALSELQRRTSRWIMVQSFRAKDTPDTSTQPLSQVGSLRPTAPEFKPTTSTLPSRLSNAEAEDGEVRDHPDRRLPAKPMLQSSKKVEIPSAPSRNRPSLPDRLSTPGAPVPGLPSRPPPPSGSRLAARDAGRDPRSRDSGRDDRNRDRDNRANLEHGRLERPSVRDLPQLPERRAVDSNTRDKDQSSSRRDERDSRSGRERTSHRTRDETPSGTSSSVTEPTINPARAAAILGVQTSDASSQGARSSSSRKDESRSERRGRSPRRDRERGEDNARDDRHNRDKESRSGHEARSDSSRPDRRDNKDSERSDSHRDKKESSRSERSERGDKTDTKIQESTFGRLNQPVPAADIPVGPRGNRARGAARNIPPTVSTGQMSSNVSGPTSLPPNPVAKNMAPIQRQDRFQQSQTSGSDSRRPGNMETQPPTGPASSRRGRGSENVPTRPGNSMPGNPPTGPSERHRQQPPSGPASSIVGAGIHPDRLHNLPAGGTSSLPNKDSFNNASDANSTPLRARAGGSQRQLAGIQSHLQQAQNAERSRRPQNSTRQPLGPEPTAPTGPAADADRERMRPPSSHEDTRSSGRPDRDRRDRNDRTRRSARDSSRDHQRDRPQRERDHRERSPERADREKDARNYRERDSSRPDVTVPPPPPGQPPRDTRRSGGRDRDHRHRDTRQAMSGANANMIPIPNMGHGAPNGPKASMGPMGVNAAPLGHGNNGSLNGGDRDKQRTRR